ncbi:CHAT domain-containing protein [Camillea tinctor]|nr:CHAT domain-containing protein [Camillea tinctor]
MMRYGKMNSKRDCKLAMALWKRVLFSRSFPPVYTVNAAVEAVEILKKHQEYKAALKIARGAIPILGKTSPLSIQAFDQQRILERYDGLASDAAALTLECRGGEAASTAVSLLEQGRGILADHQYHSRSDLSLLTEKYPTEADRFKELINSTNRQKAERDLDKLIDEIRKLPGFKYFLRPQALSELYKVAEARKQAVVIVNVSFRCDALIIHAHQTKVIQLNTLSKADIARKAQSWVIADAIGCNQILQWLWDSIASPILSALEMDHPPVEGNPWPRICWIPTGALCRLPLHAAGYHKGSMDNTVLNRAISSYSATGKALIYSHQNKVRAAEQVWDDPTRRGLLSALLVSMPTTSRLRRLPGAETEIAGIQHFLNQIPSLTVTSLSMPSKEVVMESLSHSHIFHFAGHGVLDKRDISKSALIMSDEHLTVADLLSLKLHTRPPLLAYLSACSTGIDGSSSLFDQGMHLVAACQVAGFQNVIGTFWKVWDQFCIKIALEVYKKLCEQPEMALSEALHVAVRKGRNFELKDEPTITPRDGVPDMELPRLEIEDPRHWAAYFIAGVD